MIEEAERRIQMKLVINISSEDIIAIKFHNVEEFTNEFIQEIFDSIRNGTPLPKGHGRLIDESKINKVYTYTDKAIANNIKAISTIITGTDAPTIIEADKE